jgi:hypothetical protein
MGYAAQNFEEWEVELHLRGADHQRGVKFDSRKLADMTVRNLQAQKEKGRSPKRAPFSNF